MVNKYPISHLAANDSFRAFLATDPETALTAREVTLTDAEHKLVERLCPLARPPRRRAAPTAAGRWPRQRSTVWQLDSYPIALGQAADLAWDAGIGGWLLRDSNDETHNRRQLLLRSLP